MIEIKNVSKSFGTLEVLKNINLTINKGEVVCIIGPTGTTQKIIQALAATLSTHVDLYTPSTEIDFTLPNARTSGVNFQASDLLIIGVPVYAGRVPNVLLKYLNDIVGNGAMAIPVVVYGNRQYDDALIELSDILKMNGFRVIAAAAFIGEHAFSYSLAKDRPDAPDMDRVQDFGSQIHGKICAGEIGKDVNINGNCPYRAYYRPLDEAGNPVDLRAVRPKTSSACTDCKSCVNVCPMGSIDSEDVRKFNSICIKCGACIKKCPVHAKYYDDENYLRHKQELEAEFCERREPEIFI